jgi:pimeloyl-ACP methyl ester carboxylesterase
VSSYLTHGPSKDVLEIGAADAEPIAFLHGILGRPTAFLESLASATGCRVLAPALPGFERNPGSPPRSHYEWIIAMSEIITSCNLAGLPVVAASIGAMLALDLATVRPEAFTRIVAISPFGLWQEDDPVADLFAVPASAHRTLLVHTDHADELFEEAPDLDAAEALDRAVHTNNARRAAASLLWPIPDRGVADRIRLATLPVGLIWGERDELNPPSYMGRWEALLPNSVGTDLIADAGHCAEWDEPLRVANAVASLLLA